MKYRVDSHWKLAIMHRLQKFEFGFLFLSNVFLLLKSFWDLRDSVICMRWKYLHAFQLACFDWHEMRHSLPNHNTNIEKHIPMCIFKAWIYMFSKLCMVNVAVVVCCFFLLYFLKPKLLQLMFAIDYPRGDGWVGGYTDPAWKSSQGAVGERGERSDTK